MSARKKPQRKTIPVKGMHCRSCVNSIEGTVGQLRGVMSASASLRDNSATVEYDPSIVNIEDIKGEIRSLGFSVDGMGPAKRNTTLLQGVGYALLPHTGCIAFIIGSILGVTFLMQFFRPLLMNRWFFHILIAISIGFATLSSAMYLRKQGLLSLPGIRRKWQYLSTMYGSTIGINLVLFLLVFPLLANVQVVSATGAAVAAGGVQDLGDSILSMSVDIPCPGHAPLISEELKTVQGVRAVTFSFPNVFDVSYDSSETTEAQMLSLEVFDEYPATVISDGTASAGDLQEVSANAPSAGDYGVCDGSCGCGGYDGD